MDDLFSDRTRLMLSPGAVLLGGFALPVGPVLLDVLAAIADAAPFRHRARCRVRKGACEGQVAVRIAAERRGTELQDPAKPDDSRARLYRYGAGIAL